MKLLSQISLSRILNLVQDKSVKEGHLVLTNPKSMQPTVKKRFRIQDWWADSQLHYLLQSFDRVV